MNGIRTTAIGIALAAGLTAGSAMAEGQQFGGYLIQHLGDLEYQEVGPGVSMAHLWGDLETGPSAVMLQIAPGNPGGMHHHSSDYHAVIVEGSSTHWIEGTDPSDADVFEVGDYWFQPAEEVHQDANPFDAPVKIFLYFPGTFDAIFAGQ